VEALARGGGTSCGGGGLYGRYAAVRGRKRRRKEVAEGKHAVTAHHVF